MKYAIEERVGCIAIIDVEIGRPGPGLHHDDADIIEYRAGKWKRGKWIVPRRIKKEIRKEYKRLEAKE